MNILRLLGLSGALLGSIALAQGPNPYNGKWVAKYKGEGGVATEAEVVVTDDSGTWKSWDTPQFLHSPKRNPCLGRDLPIAVQRASTGELAFRIEASKALAGCPNRSVTLKRVDDKTLQGRFDDGRALTLTRE